MTIRSRTWGGALLVRVGLVAAILLVTMAALLIPWGGPPADGVAIGAEPTAESSFRASPNPVVVRGDPRSDGAGPGVVGSPLAILVGVVALGLATVVVTIIIARLTHRGGDDQGR